MAKYMKRHSCAFPEYKHNQRDWAEMAQSQSHPEVTQDELAEVE